MNAQLLGVVPPAAQVRAQLRPDPLDVPPHVPARRVVVRLDQAVLRPLLQRTDGHAERLGGLARRHVGHEGARCCAFRAFTRGSARFAAHCRGFFTPANAGQDAGPARAPE